MRPLRASVSSTTAARIRGWQYQARVCRPSRTSSKRALSALPISPSSRLRGAHRCRRARARAGGALRHATPCAPSAAGCSAPTTYLPRDISVAWVRECPRISTRAIRRDARSYRYVILNRDVAPGARGTGAPPGIREPLDARAHARGGAGARRRARLQRVPRRRVPGEIAGAQRRRARRSSATATG